MKPYRNPKPSHFSILSSFIVILSLMLSLNPPQTAFAQSGDGIKREVNAETGKVSFIGPVSGRSLPAFKALGTSIHPQRPAMALAKRFGAEFGLKNPERDLSEMKNGRSDDGRLTVRFQQKYQGIPVMGGELIVNTNDNGDLYSMSGEVSPDISLPTQPGIAPEQARETALQALSKWYQKNPEDFVTTEPDLWIYDESLLRPSTRPVELVWRMEATSVDNSLPVRELVLVNAQTGSISLHFNQIDTAWSVAPAESGSIAQDVGPTVTPSPTDTPLPPAETAVITETPVATTIPPNDVTSASDSVADSPQLITATTWYVATTGNNSNSCTSTGSPCATINGAIGKPTVASGDIIKVATGTYTGSGTQVVLINKSVTLSGGWNAGFTTQNGTSTVDGQNARQVIVVGDALTVTIERFVVQNGFSSSQGSGIYNATGSLIINSSTITGNFTTDGLSGAGIFNSSGSVTLNNSNVSNNNAGSGGGGGGGGIHNGGTLTINDSIISGNKASIGGGIRNCGDATITHSNINDNTAGSGGGIDQCSNNTLTINSSSIVRNKGGDGGGISTNTGTINLNNSTVAGNAANNNGGGIYSYHGLININSSTIANNMAGVKGGGIVKLASDIVSLQNTILSENIAGYGLDCYVDPFNGSSISSAGNNLIGNTANCIYTAAAGDLLNINAGLGQLIGSPAYHPLLSSSPAINAGNLAGCSGSGGPLSTDQRGATRVGRCDIGAYEYTAPGTASYVIANAGTPQRTNPSTSFQIPLQVVVLDSIGSPVSNVTVTFTAPASGATGIFANTGTNITTALTNENGTATATVFTANTQAGSYTIIATVSGIGTPASFSLTNLGWYVTTTGNNANNCQTAVTACSTINGVLAKSGFVSNDTVLVAGGMYTGTGNEVVLLDKTVRLLGGWNSAFTVRNSVSTVDGQTVRRGITVNIGVTANLEYFTVKNSVMSTIGGGGGGIGNMGKLTLNHITISGNASNNPGGGVFNNGVLTISNTTIDNNTSGGIYNAGILTVTDSAISSNVAGGGGGIRNDGYLVLNNSTIRGNSLNYYTGEGGGIINSGFMTLNNSTISGNIAAGGRGGGIANNGNATINNSTITGNSTSQGGGISNLSGVSLTLMNSIVAGNTAVTGPDCYVSGNLISSAGYNLLGNTANCAYILGTGDLTNIDPKLGQLIGLSGYHPLLSGSPAINAGNPATPGSGGNACIAADQRGVARVGQCDIGAYEYTTPSSASSFGITSGSNQRVSLATTSALPLAVYVIDSQGSPVAGVPVIFTAPASGPSGIFSSTSANSTTVITNVGGIAAVPITANWQVGNYNVMVTVSGLPGSTNFALTNIGWFVSPSGSDSNLCNSPSLPCQTINGAIGKANVGESILVSVGTYTGSGTEVINISKSIFLFGGWDSSFTTQNGTSIVDGAGVRRGVNIDAMFGSPSATLDHFAIRNGFAAFQGGGIFSSGNLTLSNSTVSGNSAQGGGFGYGGGIFHTGSLILKNVTIAENTSIVGGGIYNGGTAAMYNSIIANNSAAAGPDCYWVSISSDHSLIGNTSGCSLTAGAGGNLLDVNPNLGAFVPGLGYYPLQFGSPAIDAGNPNTCLPVDQLGISRPQSAICDIGAIEYLFNHSSNLLLKTYNAGNGILLPGAFVCDQTDLTCAAGDTHAKAAHKYAAGTYDLYKNQFNRSSIDGNGIEIISTVHYGSNFDNAFWNGYMMIYGDGSGHGWPLADDAVAHELTHGVTQYESNLFYYYQSGAINESFSDVFGEYYDQVGNITVGDTAGVKWIIGEDISGWTNPAPLPAIGLRSMSNPPAYGDPDKMSSPNYHEGADDGGGVHSNSGINNKAVYLMVDGGVFNGKTVTALGWDKTAAIYYEVNTNLLTTGADYSDLYYALQQACLTRIGQKGITAADCTEVKDAIDAVEMNGQPAPNFNTDAPLCSTAGTVPNFNFVDDLESGTGNWTFDNGAYTRWQWDSPYGSYAQSGSHSLFADDYPQYQGNTTDAKASLTSIVVPSNAYLHFAQAYDFEQSDANYDGGVIEYSTNGGSSWQDGGSLIDYNGYTGTIYANYINPLKGRSAFVGASHGYISTRLNLSSLSGQSVRFRWRMGLDDDVSSLGWLVDNIKIYTCVTAPSHNDFDTPVVIPSQPYLHTVDVTNATQDVDDPTVPVSCDGELLAKGRASVWYKYIPAASANVSLDTLGSSYDTYLAVWTGTRNNLSLVGCDNNTATSSQSQLSLFLTAGTPYFIEVAEPTTGSPAANRSLTLHATTFADVPGNHVFWRYIEGFYSRRITTGCGANPFSYCPDAPVNRAAMAVFILRAKYGASHVPDPAQTNIFSDLPIAGQEWMQPWIEEFYEEGVTTGCGASPLIYCPQSSVTREAMAVFLLRAKYGAGYTPPPASNPPLFADVPVAGKEWMQPWIEEFYRQGYTTGCGTAPLIYCPSATVNRAAMAVFISRVFNIPQVP